MGKHNLRRVRWDDGNDVDLSRTWYPTYTPPIKARHPCWWYDRLGYDVQYGWRSITVRYSFDFLVCSNSVLNIALLAEKVNIILRACVA